ncbi:MAG: nucleoside monophosphate kinase [Oscillospiraceae bacterium]|nr:nucleoside monophosphate kinase [Oscillospiraceae bacterium]
MYIIMLGTPGSGKGTVGEIISKALDLAHISTGDIFREYINNGSELGKQIQDYMLSGLLVPDELTIKVIYDRLQQKDVKYGALLDGYPRTKIQAQKLDEFLESKQEKIDYALYLNVEEKIILDRILKRRICSNNKCRAIYNLEYKKPKVENICDKCGSPLIQRKDDNEEIFKQRLEVYKETAPAIIDYYRRTGVLHTKNITEANHKTSMEVAEEFIMEVRNKLIM